MTIEPGKKTRILISLVVIGSYIVIRFIPQLYSFLLPGKDVYQGLSYPVKVLLCHGTNLFLCFFVTFMLAGRSLKEMLEMLGLGKEVLPAFGLALLASLPQLLGMQFLHGFNSDANITDIWLMGIHPGYYEEILFRGFLIGLLVRYARWPVLVPLVLSGLMFGLGHLYQAHNLTQSVVVFLTAFGAGTGFFMLYKYTGWNLWFPVFLHAFMDTSTVISNYEGNITMSLNDNIFRGSTIIIVAYIAYRISMKKGLTGKMPEVSSGT